MVFWTIATWVITPIFIAMYGFNGVAYASALIALSVVIVIYLVRRYVKFDVIKVTIYPLISSIVMGLIIYFLSPVFVKSILSLILMILFGAVVYFSCVFILAKQEILENIQLVRSNLKK